MQVNVRIYHSPVNPINFIPACYRCTVDTYKAYAFIVDAWVVIPTYMLIPDPAVTFRDMAFGLHLQEYLYAN